MARKRRRNRPRTHSHTNEEEGFEGRQSDSPKKANTPLWALVVGLLIGMIGFSGGLVSSLHDAIILGSLGFIVGAAAGAIAALGIQWPRNKDMSDYSGKVPGWGPYGKHYENPLLEMMAEEEYRQKNKARQDADE